MNPMQLIQMVRNSQNPMQMLQQMAGQDPVIARAFQMTQGKTPDQVMTVVNNLAKTQGVDIDKVKSQLGL